MLAIAGAVAILGCKESGLTIITDHSTTDDTVRIIVDPVPPGPDSNKLTVKLDGKSVGSITTRKWEGTSTVTEWPPSGGGNGYPPKGMAVKADSGITLSMLNPAAQDWEVSVYDSGSIPVLTPDPLAAWRYPRRDTVRLSREPFDSLAGKEGRHIFKFNLLVAIHGSPRTKLVLVQGMEYDAIRKSFSPRDSVYAEGPLNPDSHVKISMESESHEPGFSAFVFIPGSPYFALADTAAFRAFHIPIGVFPFRLLLVPARMGSGQVAVGLVYALATDSPRLDNKKTFYPVSFIDSVKVQSE